MSYEKISEGMKFNPSAALYNETIDHLARARQQDFKEGAFFDGIRSTGNALLVRIKNTTGGNLDILTACAISGTQYNLTNDDEEQTARRIVMSVTKGVATLTVPFCVTAEPIPQDGFGWAYISGIFPAKVTNGASTVSAATLCDLEDGSGNLTVAKLGRARVLYADGSTTGPVIAIVQYPVFHGLYTGSAGVSMPHTTSTSADTTTFALDRNTGPLSISQVCRTIWDGTELHVFRRTFVFDVMGRLATVSAETKTSYVI